jgi:glycosyltransferase involved in cell wall biosynthesis
MKKIFVIIPAYNEERSIGRIVKKTLQNSRITKCVVVDDCSSDGTARVASQCGAHVIHNTINIGSGASIASGLRYAVKENTDIVVLMDADGQHDPCDINRLLKGLSLSADMIIGSRYVSSTLTSTSYVRQIGTKIISIILWIRFGRRIHDPTSGFRALNKNTIKFLSKKYATVFPEPETIINMIHKGYIVQEVSVEMKPRLFGGSSITLRKAGILTLYIVYKIITER